MFGNHFTTIFSTEFTSEKKFENRSIFGKDMDKTLWLTFLGHPVYQDECSNLKQTNASARKVRSKSKILQRQPKGGQNVPFHWRISLLLAPSPI